MAPVSGGRETVQVKKSENTDVFTITLEVPASWKVSGVQGINELIDLCTPVDILD